MFTRRSDRIADGVRLLVAGVAVAVDPTLVSALRSAPSAYDALKKLAAAPPSSVGRLAEALAGAARATFAATGELPPDADLLYAQMVEIGMVGAPEIVAADMDAGAVAEAMLGKLTDPEHRSGPMTGLFRALTVPVLERLLADTAFAADLTPAFMQAVLGELKGLGAKLDRLDRLTRLEMEALANRFEIERIFGLTDDALREALEKRAEDWRTLREGVEALRGTTPRIDNVLAEVEAALERVDLAEAESLLAGIRETAAEVLRKPVEDIARIMEAQARVALLRGAAEDAFTILSGAADSFAALDPVEPARRRLAYCGRLREQGLRYGGPGLACAERMIRRALGDLSEEGQEWLWAAGQVWLGIALQEQGARVGGEAVAGLLDEAVAAYHAALRVCSEAAHPVDWATTQDNLGVALSDQGARIGGEAGAGLLGGAVAAYRAALRVRTEAAHPVAWAETQNNLGNALSDQGARIGGEAGAGLLGGAVAAYRAALRVYTEAAHPVAWATTQNNLGAALRAQGARVGGEAGAGLLLGGAVGAYRAALRVYTEAAHPVDWARAQNNLGVALRAQGARFGGEVGAGMLGAAVAAYRAALRVYTEAAHPVDWARVQNNLGNALESQVEQVGGEAGAALLGGAVAAYRAALRVRTEAAHPGDWAMTQNNLGVALQAQGERVGGEAGAALLGEAVAAYRAALRVRTEAAHPMDWAGTQNNLGSALQAQGARIGGEAGAALLGGAVAAHRAALRVRTEAAHPVDWAMTIENLGLAHEALADDPTYRDREAALKEAEECFAAALRVFDPEHMLYNHAKAAEALVRVRAKLIEL